MRQAIVAITIGAVALLLTPAAARGGDLEDLKAAHEQLTKASNLRQAEAWVAGFHDRGVGFGANSPFPRDLEGMDKDELVRMVKNAFARDADIESSVTHIDSKYRVIGDIGIVWGYGRVVNRPKGGLARTRFSRDLFIYTKSDGKWLRVAWHFSAIPSSN